MTPFTSSHLDRLDHSPPQIPPPAEFRVGVDTVIFSVDSIQNRLLVLLVRRQEDPFQGQWALPGTLVRPAESLENAAHRILQTQIRAMQLYLEQLYTFGGPHRDPREESDSFGTRYLSVSYVAFVRFQDTQLLASSAGDGKNGHSLLPDRDLPESSEPKGSLSWHPIQSLPLLAFDHTQICDYAHRRLRNKLEYSPIAFDVLPPTFTLGEVYQLYSTVLGDQFSDYSNFRARLLKLGILRATGRKASQGAGRPAALYRFDADAFERVKDKPMLFV
ncbi:MAG: NUDIX hydrolase [Synechococcaceae cyanobacterium RM1_1_27]|nr:NUDIX hydrolase [Synechococcaceae cyanobacterium SM2_3_2]NJO85558.1 NUDIX hydrolase [Synechococcaceae cyanobacterium RM1_1_27]